MKYDIFNRKALACQGLHKEQKAAFFFSKRPQKTCKNRLFRWQFLHLPPI